MNLNYIFMPKFSGYFLIFSFFFIGLQACQRPVPKNLETSKTLLVSPEQAAEKANSKGDSIFYFILAIQAEIESALSKTEEDATFQTQLNIDHLNKVVELGEDSSLIRMMLARSHRMLAERATDADAQEKHFRFAMEHYKAALFFENAPSHAFDGYWLLARDVFQKSSTELLQETEKMFEASPNNLLLQSKLAELYAQLGRLDESLLFWDRLTSKHPNREDFWKSKGQTEFAMRKYTEALSSFEKFYAQSRNQEDAWDAMRQKALCYLETGELVSAQKLLAELVQKQPNFADNWVYWGELLASEQQFKEAESALRRALSIEKRHFYAHLLLGRVLGALGRDLEVLATYEALTRYWPNRPEAWQILGQAQVGRGLYSQAILSLEKSIQLGSGSVETKFSLAEAYRLDKRMKEAAQLLESLRLQMPNQPSILRALYFLNLEQKLYADCYELALKIHSIEPSHMSAYLLGTTFERLGYLDESIIWLKRSLLLKPDFAAAWNYLGYLMAEQKVHLSQAQRYVENALRFEPQNGSYLDSLGWVYYQSGQYTKALKYLSDASRILRSSGASEPVVFEHLGDAFYKLGCFEYAQDAWKEALLSDKNKEYQKVLNQKLSQSKAVKQQSAKICSSFKNLSTQNTQ